MKRLSLVVVIFLSWTQLIWALEKTQKWWWKKSTYPTSLNHHSVLAASFTVSLNIVSRCANMMLKELSLHSHLESLLLSAVCYLLCQTLTWTRRFRKLVSLSFSWSNKFLEKILIREGVTSKVDDSGQTVGKRYARTDECGIPFAITVDFDTLNDNTVTLRDLDSMK
jgi:histidyl-tRNA synthetase